MLTFMAIALAIAAFAAAYPMVRYWSVEESAKAPTWGLISLSLGFAAVFIRGIALHLDAGTIAMGTPLMGVIPTALGLVFWMGLNAFRWFLHSRSQTIHR